MIDEDFKKARIIKRDIEKLEGISICIDVSTETKEYLQKSIKDRIKELEKEFERI